MDLLRHLEFFVAIAEEEHFGHAAARLGIAQPPLSQGLQRLERALGVVLVDRSSRGARLNAAGRDLLPRARALLEDAEDLRRAAGAHGAAPVRIGAVPQLPIRTLAVLVTACSDPPEIVTAPSTELLDALSAGRLDLAIVMHPALLGSLQSGPVHRMATALLVPAGHPAATTPGPVVMRSLRGLALATPPRSNGPAAHDLLLDTLEQRGLVTTPVNAPDDRAALALVAAGRAFAITADPDLDAPGVVRREVAGEPLPLRLRVAWRGHRPAVLDAVLDALP
ncbi:LysR family transcriptional regulator [Pseudonocardia sp. DSM 110487]|uniref:LysR family transcriptional regulator n=1 Tax=Pseudonocardia sp. DSM 110487 TaxID=2865833 RepID=UPI001C6A25CA|nr:LysR family transcriptional regulator [Pseudonocardia sp. DSM 110487]QYN32631.1 LysR family transcriptional regulator [Pseudonocardia sp. DSM 110487]